MTLQMFCVYHKQYYVRDDNKDFTFFGVNEVYEKTKDDSVKNFLEYELSIYNPFLQKRGYMETSAYLHIYWNKLYIQNDFVGVSQYDMKHSDKYENLDKNTIYILNTGSPIVKNGRWNNLMCPTIRNLDFLILSYNSFFKTTYTMKELEEKPLSLFQTNIYPKKIYEKLCSWLEVFVDEIYPWCCSIPYETHFGSISGYAERALSIFNAFEIYEGVQYKNLNIDHGVGALTKEHYNTNSFLNNYSQDVHTKYIENITGTYPESNFCMFKSQCYLNNIKHSCERIFKNSRNGLYATCDTLSIKEYGFEIEAEDPRLVVLKNKVYIIFICLSPYENQGRCIGISEFNEWNPIFLQIEGVNKNIIEKNWAPFVKDDELYFVYNYDPLVILKYDLNLNGVCQIVFRQENCEMPRDTSTTYLRGGSNLIKYNNSNRYYIGGCHSRISKDAFYHFTHLILLDVENWALIYVSKPVMYEYTLNEQLNCACETNTRKGKLKALMKFNNILIDKSPHCIQDPISIYTNSGKCYITINVRDRISLLYEIQFKNLLDFVVYKMPVSHWDNFVKDTSFRASTLIRN
jgi:hypothetical protein